MTTKTKSPTKNLQISTKKTNNKTKPAQKNTPSTKISKK